jgi:tRNA U34 5-carboxymethylaminomethyl modifying GTPase MnmE/TrmE
MTHQLLESSDLVLWVRDIKEHRTQAITHGINTTAPMVTVYNKCDLIQEYREENNGVFISAKDAVGMNQLAEVIFGTLGVRDFQFDTPVVFTERQSKIMQAFVQGTSGHTSLSQLAG